MIVRAQTGRVRMGLRSAKFVSPIELPEKSKRSGLEKASVRRLRLLFAFSALYGIGSSRYYWSTYSLGCCRRSNVSAVCIKQRDVSASKGNEDANKILSSDAACPICNQVLSDSLMKPVDLNPSDEWITAIQTPLGQRSPKPMSKEGEKSSTEKMLEKAVHGGWKSRRKQAVHGGSKRRRKVVEKDGGCRKSRQRKWWWPKNSSEKMVVVGKSLEMMVVAEKVAGEDGDRLLTFDSSIFIYLFLHMITLLQIAMSGISPGMGILFNLRYPFKIFMASCIYLPVNKQPYPVDIPLLNHIDCLLVCLCWNLVSCFIYLFLDIHQVMKSLYRSVMFFLGQRDLELWSETNRRVAQFREKWEAMKEKLTQEMEQLNTAYQKMLETCQVMEEEIQTLSKDKQELQEKFSEKSKQKRKLEEMYDQLNIEYQSIKRSAIQPVGPNEVTFKMSYEIEQPAITEFRLQITSMLVMSSANSSTSLLFQIQVLINMQSR
ncbi:hypothetical protein OSB04_028631 [Centaurea solstitialis]|uniref:Uncharacterized protein n=1 Tax=Centaurea solstitialis TaxID=347529 RepID=A0AA38STK2_9ASTR|nr:hypothetical protein OSB04_028631 [Centaurea solstitialis]